MRAHLTISLRVIGDEVSRKTLTLLRESSPVRSPTRETPTRGPRAGGTLRITDLTVRLFWYLIVSLLTLTRGRTRHPKESLAGQTSKSSPGAGLTPESALLAILLVRNLKVSGFTRAGRGIIISVKSLTGETVVGGSLAPETLYLTPRAVLVIGDGEVPVLTITGRRIGVPLLCEVTGETSGGGRRARETLRETFLAVRVYGVIKVSSDTLFIIVDNE